MTHHDGDTPTNGTDPDGTSARHWFREIPELETPPRCRRIDDDDYIPYFAGPPGGEQEHEDFVGRLIREGEALRTELGLPGFPSADAPPSTSHTGASEQPTADHADGALHETAPAPAHDAGGHRTRRRRVALRFGRSRTPRTRPIRAAEVLSFQTELIQVRAERTSTRSPLRRVRLGRIDATLSKALETGLVRDERYTARERARRMVLRYGGLLPWLFILIVVVGDVAVGMPEWLSWGSGLLLIALLLWRVLRQYLPVLVRHGLRQLLEHLHEPDLDQQAAPHKDDQRT